MATVTTGDTYVIAIGPQDCFVDQAYQRVLDVARARKIATTWDRRLVGLIEVSDRGPDASPRYAVVDGQHRWAAARFLADPPQLVANVHEGLTVEQEAELFDRLNRQRRQPTTWDHWKARRSAGDPMVAAIEQVVSKAGLTVTENTTTADGISCTATLEKIAASAGGLDLLQQTLDVITVAWRGQRNGADAPMVLGVAIAIDSFDDRISAQRLQEVMETVPPKRIRLAAITLRDAYRGSLGKLTAMAIINEYNHTPGSKLALPNRWTGGLTKPKPAAAAAKPEPPQRTPVTATVRTGIDLGKQAAERTAPIAAVTDLHCCAQHDDLPADDGVAPEPVGSVDADLIAEIRDMAELPISSVAGELGITISEVRRLRAQIGSRA